jgi:hypothetical protein
MQAAVALKAEEMGIRKVIQRSSFIRISKGLGGRNFVIGRPLRKEISYPQSMEAPLLPSTSGRKIAPLRQAKR